MTSYGAVKSPADLVQFIQSCRIARVLRAAMVRLANSCSPSIGSPPVARCRSKVDLTLFRRGCRQLPAAVRATGGRHDKMAWQSRIRVQADTISAANMPGYSCFTPSAQKMPYQIAESGAFRHVPSSAMARSTISRETPVSTMSSVDCAISLPILST